MRKLLFTLLLTTLLVSPLYSARNKLVVCDAITAPKGLNPLLQFDMKSDLLHKQLFSSLVVLGEENEMLPSLALRWKRKSPTSLQLWLRKGVKFHNGDELTAEDVVFSLKSYIASPFFPLRGFYAIIEKIEAVDKHTVLLRTKFPDGLLVRKLSILRILPQKHYQRVGATTFAKAPVGSGPFAFSKWREDGSLTMKANENYWQQVPEIKELSFRFMAQREQVKALRAGTVDLLTDLAGTETKKVALAPDLALKKELCFLNYPIAVNNQRLPFSSLQARRALNMCINRADLLKYEARGNGRLLATFSMPGEFGHNEKLKPFPYSPKEAKAAFADVFGDKPKKVKALINKEGLRVATFIKGALAALGVEMEIVFDSSFEQFEDNEIPPWDLRIGPCPNPFGHISFIQSLALCSRSRYSLTKDPVFDKKFESALGTLDLVKQEKMLKELDRYVYEQSLGLFLYQKMKIYAHRRGLILKKYRSAMPLFGSMSWRN